MIRDARYRGMVAELIFVGTELLLGQIVNTNAAYLCRNLAQLGVDVYHTCEVGDNVDRIASAVRQALSRADLVITSGGLGPTADDVTREAIAKAIGRRLVFDPKVMEGIEELFRRMGREATPIQRRQAYVFEEGCRVIPNHIGSAPGLLVEVEDKHIITLPGVPRELQAMCEEFVFSWIADRSGAGIIKSLPLKVCGLGESTVQEMIEDIMQGLSNPTIAFLARPGEVTVRITAKALNAEEADRMIAQVEGRIRERLGDNIYGVDPQTLEEVTGEMLIQRGKTVAIAETSTGGWISSRMSDVPGSERYLLGSFVLPSVKAIEREMGIRFDRIVGEDVARQMAEWVVKRCHADFGLAATALLEVMEGYSEADLGLTCLALATGSDVISKKIKVIGDKPTMKQRVSQAAIDLLRRELIR
ncbi:TPA: competence/damage-inducible protein A [Candidatus Poribacteria bacterium]|nr:competence/damage-inducible protein A [Candidatus Poribacteria bacterium]